MVCGFTPFCVVVFHDLINSQLSPVGADRLVNFAKTDAENLFTFGECLFAFPIKFHIEHMGIHCCAIIYNSSVEHYPITLTNPRVKPFGVFPGGDHINLYYIAQVHTL